MPRADSEQTGESPTGSCWSESLSAVLTAHLCLGRGELEYLAGFGAFELFIYPTEGAFLQDGMFHLPLEHPVSKPSLQDGGFTWEEIAIQVEI